MDPITKLLSFLNPQPQPTPNPWAATIELQPAVPSLKDTTPTGPELGEPGFADVLGALNAPTVTPHFSGGVSGVRTPTPSAMPNIIGPELARQAAPNPIQTLGALLSQAPGGGR